MPCTTMQRRHVSWIELLRKKAWPTMTVFSSIAKCATGASDGLSRQAACGQPRRKIGGMLLKKPSDTCSRRCNLARHCHMTGGGEGQGGGNNHYGPSKPKPLPPKPPSLRCRVAHLTEQGRAWRTAAGAATAMPAASSW